jgi:hypothetical protein
MAASSKRGIDWGSLRCELWEAAAGCGDEHPVASLVLRPLRQWAGAAAEDFGS